MGSVRVDVHRRENTLQQQYPIASIQGVVSFLDNIHHIRNARFKGDIDASIMLLDFMDAYKNAGLANSELEVLYLRYEKELTSKEVASKLGLSLNTVKQYGRRACEKIAKRLEEDGGYNDVIQ